MNLLEELQKMKLWPTCSHVSPQQVVKVVEPVASFMADLGCFDVGTAAEAETAKVEYAGNKSLHILIFHFTDAGNGNLCSTGVIFQTFHEKVCSQLYLRGTFKAYRNITFTDTSLTEIQTVGNWSRTS